MVCQVIELYKKSRVIDPGFFFVYTIAINDSYLSIRSVPNGVPAPDP